ncbi:hypothetical protein GETHLI_25170 [Geothrix limicola]|uniref:Sel1 repeat family protein n=1 Tax=Geothrix limicola TaxID=2927978 RepID=A0ABQ5QIK2_9BACT|nr:hypothetical protein [Geothrix limicola]GLH74015.1 hypothetical protein GETHLI_25170 [Geothrix limicola]
MSDPKPIDPAKPEPSPDATQRLPLGAPADPRATQAMNIGAHLEAEGTLKMPAGAPEPPADQTLKSALPRLDEPPIRVQRMDAPAEAAGQTLQRPADAPRSVSGFGWKLPLALLVLAGLGVAGYLFYPRASAPLPAPYSQTAATPESTPVGVQVYLEQAKAGDVHAMRMLGAYYYNGLNVPQDREKGLYWYRKAAEKGSDAAKAELKQIEGRP